MIKVLFGLVLVVAMLAMVSASHSHEWRYRGGYGGYGGGYRGYGGGYGGYGNYGGYGYPMYNSYGGYGGWPYYGKK
uniref:Uncharacterized protein n=1 Tax=Panagrolaimus sp. JU765 TaxID=591449 RepID=A0AC34QTQ9_9BILA